MRRWGAMLVHAHRGNTFAAGTVVLTALVVEIELRPSASSGLRLALTVGLAVLALVGALGSPEQDDGPRTYQELLLAIAASATTAATAHALTVAGVGPGRPVAASWVAVVAAVGAVVGLGLARLREGTIVLGLGAAAAVVALGAAAGAAWPGRDPIDGVRWALVVALLMLVLAIVLRIDRRYREAVVLADVLGGAVLALAATFLVDLVPGATSALGLPDGRAGAGAGWLLLLLVAGFALVGLGSTLHERAPGWIGALSLAAALGALARDGGDGAWIVVLAVAGAVIVAVALRPVARPVPQEVEDDRPLPDPVSWPRPALAALRRDDDPED